MKRVKGIRKREFLHSDGTQNIKVLRLPNAERKLNMRKWACEVRYEWIPHWKQGRSLIDFVERHLSVDCWVRRTEEEIERGIPDSNYTWFKGIWPKNWERWVCKICCVYLFAFWFRIWERLEHVCLIGRFQSKQRNKQKKYKIVELHKGVTEIQWECLQ